MGNSDIQSSSTYYIQYHIHQYSGHAIRVITFPKEPYLKQTKPVLEGGKAEQLPKAASLQTLS